MRKPGGPLRPAILRLVPPLAVLLLAALLATLYAAGLREPYDAILKAFGFIPFETPFLDSKVALAAAQCHAAGFDVYVNNPCDPLGRVQFYSPLIPRMSALGLHHLDLNLLGLCLIGLYAGAINMIFRPQSLGGAALFAFAAISYPSVFALERGQLEILIFVFAAVLWALHDRGLAGRLFGYGLVLAAGALKMFPIALLALAVRERPRTALLVFGGGFLATVLMVGAFRGEYQQLTSHIERCGYFCDQFWVGNLVFAVTGIDRFEPPGLLLRAVVTLAFAALSCMVAATLSRRGFAPEGDREAVLLTIGAILVVASYLAESNTYYRAMHLLLTMPFLMAAAAGRVKGVDRRFGSVLLAGLLAILWIGPVFPALFVTGREIPASLPAVKLILPAAYVLRDFAWFLAMAAISGVAIVTLLAMSRPLLEAVGLKGLSQRA